MRLRDWLPHARVIERNRRAFYPWESYLTVHFWIPALSARLGKERTE